jgi:hypothetical protein
MKTNKEKNQEHDARMSAKVRPKPVAYEFEALEAVMRQWVAMNEQT